MGAKPAVFQSGGQASQHYLPGAYSRLDFVKGAAGLVSINNAVIMGKSKGGKPNTLLWFSSPAEAKDALVEGELLDAIRHAFNPGGGLVPQRIAAWRVNPGTQATRTMQNSTDDMIDITSWDYGVHTNQLKMKMESGTVSGKKLTFAYKDSSNIVIDNIIRPSFEIQYTGAGTACTMAISTTAITTLVDAVADLNVPFASFETIGDVVDYINDQAGYTCTLKTGNPADPSDELDSLTATAIKAAPVIAYSTLQAIIDALNTIPWVGDAEWHSGATDRLIPDNDAAWVYFSGGTVGAYTTTEFTTSLGLLAQEDIQMVSSSSTDAAVHALIKAHCETASSVEGRSERQFIVGGAYGETVSQAATRATNLASAYGALCYPGFQQYAFDSSVVQNWAPSYYAAKLIGMFAALALPEPATNKDISVLSWEKDLTLSETNTLIAAGVCVGIKNKANRLVCGRSVTTYAGSDLQQVEFSMMREALFINRDLRVAVEEIFIGKAMTNALLGRVDAIVTGKLSSYFDLGVFNGAPPYWGYQKQVVGDQIKIEYNCYLTPPTNFIFITSHMHVFASTATA